MNDFQQKARKELDRRGEEIVKCFEAYVIPDAVMVRVVDHAIKMLCNHPDLKSEKIVRRTAEHFKLKTRSAKVVSMATRKEVEDVTD
jgi:hypothetical protein